MKQPPYTAAPLVGKSDQKSSLQQLLFGHLAGPAYYEAHSEAYGVYLLWMEFSRFGQLRTYPCVLHERDQAPLVFSSFSPTTPDAQNTLLVQRWEELVTPEAFQRFQVSKLDKEAFQKIYRTYRGGET